MRVLHISHNHHIVGGSDRVFFETSALLEGAGHEVIPFCMRSEQDRPTPWSDFFPTGAKTNAPGLRDSPKYFYNLEARKALQSLIDVAGPIDVAHLHIYHGKMTPAILPVLRANGIPIVHTLHEYKLACPVYTMQRQGVNCDACVSGNPIAGIRHRCKDGSFAKSAVMVAEMIWSRLLGDVRLVDRFICVSDFQRKVMIRAGLPLEKLVTLHNFVKRQDADPGHDGYLLYAGRIEAMKGLSTLLKATELSGHKLLIAGDGAWATELAARAAKQPNVTVLGFRSGSELSGLISRAKAVVVPSDWYENCPMSVLEAKAAGRPVVASDIGGIPELVRDGTDGFLFAPGDSDGLCEALRRLDTASHAALSKNAVVDMADRFSPEAHLERLLQIYADSGVAAAQMSTQRPSQRTEIGRAQRITV